MLQPECSPCFRVHENAAPLKLGGWMLQPECSPCFRVHENAAPLKRCLLRCSPWQGRTRFRVHENAAPLKLVPPQFNLLRRRVSAFMRTRPH